MPMKDDEEFAAVLEELSHRSAMDWTSAKLLFKEDDGRRIIYLFCQEVNGGWEYARVLTYTDGAFEAITLIARDTVKRIPCN
jgi:hypothetical protein